MSCIYPTQMANSARIQVVIEQVMAFTRISKLVFFEIYVKLTVGYTVSYLDVQFVGNS